MAAMSCEEVAARLGASTPSKLIEFGVSTGGVVQVNLDPFLRLERR